MASKGKEIGLVGLLLVVGLLWWLLHADSSPAAALAADVASGKLPQIPEFGTDATIDAADALSTAPLNLGSPTLGGPTNSTGF